MLDIHAGSAGTLDQRFTLTVKMHSLPSGFGGRYPHRNRQHVRSRRQSHHRISQRSDWPKRLDIHTESADTFDQHFTLTVKMHSLPSGFEG
ncbi:hypothetical protein DIE18_13035 [Burkholderia sp. Bp9125]|nr:hypothetical protein DIE18_13035 [Burkholderia sp. Bp9125]